MPNGLKDMLKNVSEILTLDPQTGQRTRTPISNTSIAKLASILAKEPYKLLSTEIAGVINQVPRTTIDLGLIVEEAEDRFSEELLEEMVGLVDKYLVEASVVNAAPVVSEAPVVNVAPVAPMMPAPTAPMLPVSQ
ncbi:CGRP receptor component [Venturia nashicola]|nr:CGRP receptor component [Venturia nashicola]